MQIQIQFTPDELMRASKSGVLEDLFEITKSPAERTYERQNQIATEKEKAKPEPEKTVEKDTPPGVEKEITLEDVRAAFMAKNSKANAAKLKGVLEKHGVKKVTDLKSEDFVSVLSSLEAI